MDAVDASKMVLKGYLMKSFTAGFWQQIKAKQNAVKCIIYLVEEILEYDDEMLKNNFFIFLNYRI